MNGTLVCDFCSGTPIAWRYPARDFQRNYSLAEVRVEANSRGDWAACAICHTFIQASNRDALAERSIASFPLPWADIPPNVRVQLKAEIRAMQDTFWSAREGAPAPMAIS